LKFKIIQALSTAQGFAITKSHLRGPGGDGPWETTFFNLVLFGLTVFLFLQVLLNWLGFNVFSPNEIWKKRESKASKQRLFATQLATYAQMSLRSDGWVASNTKPTRFNAGPGVFGDSKRWEFRDDN